MLKRLETIIPKAETAFKVLYILLVLLSFTNLMVGNPVLRYYTYALVLFGAVLLLYRAVHFKRFVRTKGLWILVLFCGSILFSAFLNRKYGLTESLQSFIWTTLQFGLLYACDEKRDIQEYQREFCILAVVFSVYILLANIVSIGMFFAHYGVFGQYSFNETIIGFVWGRLWGVYSDPNNGSVLCVASVVLSICAWAALKPKSNRGLKALLAVNIILDYFYIMLSDSRTGMVCALIGVACALFLCLSARDFQKEKLKPILKNTVCLMMAIVLSCAFYFGSQLLKKGYNFTLEKVIEAKMQDPDASIDDSNLVLITGRDEADTESDVSNRRFSLWKSGIEIWRTSPIFGVSQRNITSYAKDVLPNTYLVNNDLSDFDSTHNMFIDVLVSQGIVGILLIVAFFVSVAVLIIKRFLLIEKNRTNIYLIALISVLVVFACSCMFVLDVLYLNSAATILFWSALGYLTHSLQKDKI